MQSQQRPQLILWRTQSWNDPSELFQIRAGYWDFVPPFNQSLDAGFARERRWLQSRWLFPVKDNQQEGELSWGLSAPSASRELDASVLKGRSGKHTTENTTVVVLYDSCHLHFSDDTWGWTSFGIWIASLVKYLLKSFAKFSTVFFLLIVRILHIFKIVLWIYILDMYLKKLSRIYNIQRISTNG